MLANGFAYLAVQSPEWWRREIGIEPTDDERAELLALAVRLGRGGDGTARGESKEASMKRRIEKAGRRARLRGDLVSDLYKVVTHRLSGEPPDDRESLLKTVIFWLIEDLCLGITNIDNDLPQKAREYLMVGLLRLATIADRREERTEEESALWKDIVEGRRNIAEIMPAIPDEEADGPGP